MKNFFVGFIGVMFIVVFIGTMQVTKQHNLAESLDSPFAENALQVANQPVVDPEPIYSGETSPEATEETSMASEMPKLEVQGAPAPRHESLIEEIISFFTGDNSNSTVSSGGGGGSTGGSADLKVGPGTGTGVSKPEKVFLMGGVGTNPCLNDVWSSSDGINWNNIQPSAAWSARAHFAAMYLNNKLWVVGGLTCGGQYMNDVWSSTDGINWTLVNAAAPWTGREIFAATVFNGRMWIFGGHYTPFNPYIGNEIWSSADGANWLHEDTNPTQVGIQDAPWPNTQIFTGAAVLNGKIFLMSGTGNGFHNNIWSSVDGRNWVHVDTNPSLPGIQDAPWAARTYPSLNVLNNTMYIAGGIVNGFGMNNDVWSSGDGISWTQINQTTTWPARAWHKSFALNNQNFIVGGSNSSQTFNDIWSSSGGSGWLQQLNASWQSRFGHQVVLTPSTFGQCEISIDNTILPSYVLSTGANKTIARVWVKGCYENTTLRQLTYQISRQPTSYTLSNIRLFQGATLLANAVPVAGTTIPTYTFSKNITIPANSTTQIFDIKADVTGTLVQGSSQVTTTLIGADIVIPGQNNIPAVVKPLPLPSQYIKY